MALVVLIQGDHPWAETTWRDLGPGLEALSHVGPEDSVATVLGYHDTIDVLHPMAPLAELAGVLDPLDGARESASGNGLIPGLEAANELLATHADKRRIVVVIGNGEGRQNDVPSDLRKAIDAFKQARVEVYTLHHRVVPTDSPIGMQNMAKLGYSGSKYTDSSSELASKLEQFVAAIDARYYVTFDGFDPESGGYFTHDGTEREYTLEVGDEGIEELTARTLAWASPGQKARPALSKEPVTIDGPEPRQSRSGCGCHTGGAGSSGPMIFLIGCAWLLATRRRRR